ncbi:MAG: chemotaxis protein CheW [Methylotetracoccus sp.]
MLLIQFRIGDQAYAVSASDVQRILPLPRLDAFPAGPPGLRGVFLYRGALMPVIDLRFLLEGTTSREGLGSRLLLVGTRASGTGDTPAFAMLADRVSVFRASGETQATLTLPSAGEASCVGPLLTIDGIPTRVVEWQRLLTPDMLAIGEGTWNR